MTTLLILILDDHPSLRRNLRAMLEDEDFDVLEAESGEIALQIVQTILIDIVIVDIRLPGMNGNEFIGAAHAIRPQLHFVIHTGAANYQLPDNLRQLGLTEDCIFMKPLANPALLFARLKQLNKS